MTKQQKMLEEIGLVIKDIFWIACVWNDHNFNYDDLIQKANKITDALCGGERFRGVDACNEWLEECSKAIAEDKQCPTE